MPKLPGFLINNNRARGARLLRFRGPRRSEGIIPFNVPSLCFRSQPAGIRLNGTVGYYCRRAPDNF